MGFCLRDCVQVGVLVCSISPDDMREIYDVNIACESIAAELLAALPESERRIKADALDALNATMGLALQENDLVAWAKADDEFHRLLVVSCGNGRFARIAETIMDQSQRARTLSPLNRVILARNEFVASPGA
jgi:DNA-binding GntR family transcriptional regulator